MRLQIGARGRKGRSRGGKKKKKERKISASDSPSVDEGWPQSRDGWLLQLEGRRGWNATGDSIRLQSHCNGAANSISSSAMQRRRSAGGVRRGHDINQRSARPRPPTLSSVLIVTHCASLVLALNSRQWARRPPIRRSRNNAATGCWGPSWPMRQQRSLVRDWRLP